jgi:hypothetical protein
MGNVLKVKLKVKEVQGMLSNPKIIHWVPEPQNIHVISTHGVYYISLVCNIQNHCTII